MNAEQMITLSTAWMRLWTDANAVILYRMAGFSGLARSAPDEFARMWTEKPPAFVEAALAASQATMAGQRPDQIALAALAPVERAAKANSRRLGAASRRRSR
ncbi:hypothetical protein OG2516_14346 [Oceanicola granulosus HTCC2516]|uniref:Antifreeze protein n=1 Tax=Oceanicola granulosus (strain ATCC BAA-861 / DSM 15982 / KCTC 12143 / HTCC2516) TaxID=314256 RepID=Q2CB08_OCEGH|nr:hypothetical protein [Oceanicola granulosus]EAR49868.1 hypothetical protein OG2516_14346 [Oceanicola granulosus HTCC2516]